MHKQITVCRHGVVLRAMLGVACLFLFVAMYGLVPFGTMHFIRAGRRTAQLLRQQNSAVQQARVLHNEAQVFTQGAQLLGAQHARATQTERLLPVRRILQQPELPHGCEITSAAIVLNYLGFPADKLVLVQTYLDKQTPYYETDPNQAYMGDPRTNGWYCYPPVIVRAVNDYLRDEKALRRIAAQDATGTQPQQLRDYLYAGVPVIVWVTIDFAPPLRSEKVTLPDGTAPYRNLHCCVLTGYDENYYYLADPLGEFSRIERRRFERIYQKMGSRAVVLLGEEGTVSDG